MKLLFNIIFSLMGFGAIILEFFVPSAGVIGLLGAGFVIMGIVLTFIHYGVMGGTIFLIICALIGPTILYLYFKLFPKSYIGKKLILDKSMNSDKGWFAGEEIGALLKREGTAATALRPIGEAIIDKSRYNVTTNGEFIEKNSHIIVIKIEGNIIVVAQKESV